MQNTLSQAVIHEVICIIQCDCAYFSYWQGFQMCTTLIALNEWGVVKC